MNDPILFKTYREKTNKNSESIAEKYFYLLDETENKESAVLDIGSGPGNLTRGLLDLFKVPICKLVGTDISKTMVDFANATYGDNIVSFELFDIGKEVPEKYLSYFDYVFSFWTLHWIRDQRTLFSNIYKVMKPNSQMLVSFIAQSKANDIYQLVWRKPEYSPYITDFNASRSFFQDSKNPKNELQCILEECGFEVTTINIETSQSKPLTRAAFKEFIASLNPHYNQIPSHLQDKFIEDHVAEFTDGYYLEHNIFVVHAKKK